MFACGFINIYISQGGGVYFYILETLYILVTPTLTTKLTGTLAKLLNSDLPVY